MDGSSVSGAPNLRHPYTIRSRHAKFRADEQRARCKVHSIAIDSADTGHLVMDGQRNSLHDKPPERQLTCLRYEDEHGCH